MFSYIFRLFLLDLFNLLYRSLNRLGKHIKHLMLLRCDAKYEGSTSYVHEFFMNIILPISRLPFVTFGVFLKE